MIFLFFSWEPCGHLHLVAVIEEGFKDWLVLPLHHCKNHVRGFHDVLCIHPAYCRLLHGGPIHTYLSHNYFAKPTRTVTSSWLVPRMGFDPTSKVWRTLILATRRTGRLHLLTIIKEHDNSLSGSQDLSTSLLASLPEFESGLYGS